MTLLLRIVFEASIMSIGKSPSGKLRTDRGQAFEAKRQRDAELGAIGMREYLEREAEKRARMEQQRAARLAREGANLSVRKSADDGANTDV